MIKRIIHILLLLPCGKYANSQSQTGFWHDKERTIHYRPEGKDFVTENGTRRFNRALYGTNTAFRVEAGDLPEFAMYLPGMGGNLKFGLISGDKSKWLINANSIKAIYRPGMMLYEIKDSMLGKGIFYITVLALSEEEGIIVQTRYAGNQKKVSLMWAFGGVTGKRFSRDGDIGADPESSFYLQAGNCKGNVYVSTKNKFRMNYADGKELSGLFPSDELKTADAAQQETPLQLLQSAPGEAPVIAGKKSINAKIDYFLLLNSARAFNMAYDSLSSIFEQSKTAVTELTNRIQVKTPDPYINTVGGALAIAADAIWEEPSYLHGAVAWRIRLGGWRGAYAADVLGWHDRARTHFTSYAQSQIISPLTGPVIPDTALHFARQMEKLGTSIFSNGYICRNPGGRFVPHHYDMNLVYIDQLLNHFNWTGDTAYVRQMWPVIERHLAWEKRNFDADNDGLYDAYAAIWASDALQYNGGGVTHTSAYNYRANKSMAALARLIGKDASVYETEAAKIHLAVQNNLWLPKQGWFAEYKDRLGLQLVHSAAGIWTIYHAIDAKLCDFFDSYQVLRYVDNEIPHIPVRTKGLADTTLYLLSTTNWQPYTWSVNNVGLAENLHMALAYWQGSRPEEAFRLWKSALVESMYLGASPGNFTQLHFYDAIRGELYRDFADPVGMAARTLVEGLFGIQPDIVTNTLTIQPGFPQSWPYAELKTPDIQLSFSRKKMTDQYEIKNTLPPKMDLRLLIRSYYDDVLSVMVNGNQVSWSSVDRAIGMPAIEINVLYADHYSVVIQWKGKTISPVTYDSSVMLGEKFKVTVSGAKIQDLKDPQKAVDFHGHINQLQLTALSPGNKTMFVDLKQGNMKWYYPLAVNITQLVKKRKAIRTGNFDRIDLTAWYNDKVTNIFRQQYLSPRLNIPTLALPWQGIGNWCYPLTMAAINDSGLRQSASGRNMITTPDGVSFATPSDTLQKNVVFTSLWDNYPDETAIPLQGKATLAHLLMAGTTNPMQSRLVNGEVIFRYKDGTADTLSLKNPENWWPIEQDYYIDGYAFTTDAPIPWRLYLKQGVFSKEWKDYTTIRGFSNRGIDGGAATVLDLPLNPDKELKDMIIRSIANDVVIGLMSVTLER
jgi:hypothetical protein